MITYNTVLKQPLMDTSSINDEQPFEYEPEIDLKAFKIGDILKEEPIQRVMKAKIGERIFILRQIKADISNYIIEDIEN